MVVIILKEIIPYCEHCVRDKVLYLHRELFAYVNIFYYLCNKQRNRLNTFYGKAIYN